MVQGQTLSILPCHVKQRRILALLARRTLPATAFIWNVCDWVLNPGQLVQKKPRRIDHDQDFPPMTIDVLEWGQCAEEPASCDAAELVTIRDQSISLAWFI